PGRVSTTNAWPCLRPISSATRRATRSLTPPGGFGTTNLIGLGVCGQAASDITTAAARERIAKACLRTRPSIVTIPGSLLSYLGDHLVEIGGDHIRWTSRKPIASIRIPDVGVCQPA